MTAGDESSLAMGPVTDRTAKSIDAIDLPCDFLVPVKSHVVLLLVGGSTGTFISVSLRSLSRWHA